MSRTGTEWSGKKGMLYVFFFLSNVNYPRAIFIRVSISKIKTKLKIDTTLYHLYTIFSYFYVYLIKNYVFPQFLQNKNQSKIAIDSIQKS
jgi:hypothetical protein